MYEVKARYYSERDNFGETFVVTSDGSEVDRKLEIGQKIKLVSDEDVNRSVGVCAVCGKRKHLPLKRGEMGGYVCLACVDAKLDEYAKASEIAEKTLESIDRAVVNHSKGIRSKPLDTDEMARVSEEAETSSVKMEKRKIRAQVGYSSKVRVSRMEYPLPLGNYFSFASGERCLNMWAENLNEIVNIKAMEEVMCAVFTSGDPGATPMAIVIDKRIPEDWLNKELCMTGAGYMTRGVIEACYSFAGKRLPSDAVCGCEAPDQLVKIPGIRIDGQMFNVCGNCGRRWKFENG